MNPKVAKQLRKIAGYHPSNPEQPKLMDLKPGRSGRSSKVLDPDSAKAKYKLLKKEYSRG